MSNNAQIVREALTGEHRSGAVQPDRGDELHWLTCVDCGGEWAENDDGSHAAGEMECEHTALAALDALEAEVERLREALGEMRRLIHTRRVSLHMDGTETFAVPILSELNTIARAALAGEQT